jgi:hypothetical protein
MTGTPYIRLDLAIATIGELRLRSNSGPFGDRIQVVHC